MSNAKKPTTPWLRLTEGERQLARDFRNVFETTRVMNRRRTQAMRRQANVNKYLDGLFLENTRPLLTKELDEDLALRDMDQHHISSFN